MKSQLDKIRARLSEANEGSSKYQSKESLECLANDIGLVINPTLNLAGQVASETLRLRADIDRLIRCLEKCVEQRDTYLPQITNHVREKKKQLDTELSRILGGEK